LCLVCIQHYLASNVSYKPRPKPYTLKIPNTVESIIESPIMSELNTLAISLIHQTNPSLSSNPEANRIAISQTQHRLNLLAAWFGTLDAAQIALSGKTILEIGCGQGDMTVALAWAVGPTGTVHAIDPAPLDYGSPETLQQAQERVSRSEIGGRIEWVQADPVEALGREARLGKADYVVLAHSLLYMRSREYLGELFGALRPASKTPRLLLAEWGMRVSNESAKAHLLAVKAQAAQPLESGNVQLYLEPKDTMEIATKVGWKSERETWIESPDLDDGAWEVWAARSMPVSDDTEEATRAYLEELDRLASEPVKSMDVWTGVLY
jgi:SAM-dependent methyltransferase